jgi:hypothetical protein
MPGAIPGWVANLVHESNFQSANATFCRCSPSNIPSGSWSVSSLRRRDPSRYRRRRIRCCDRIVGSGRELLKSEIALCKLAPSKSAVPSTRRSDAGGFHFQ